MSSGKLSATARAFSKGSIPCVWKMLIQKKQEFPFTEETTKLRQQQLSVARVRRIFILREDIARRAFRLLMINMGLLQKQLGCRLMMIFWSFLKAQVF